MIGRRWGAIASWVWCTGRLCHPEGGYDYNHSNNMLEARDRGQIMNKTPMSKEFCWLRL